MMVVQGFRNLAVVILYVLALISLALHLTHGIQSMFQTVGLNNERSGSFISQAGIITAIILFLGFAAIPMTVLAGLVR